MEINKDLQKIIEEKKGNLYDVVVMYTGGKDSSYLIYLLKEIYNLRILAVTVDNGYEFSTSYSRMKNYVDNVKVPLEVIKPEKIFFTKLYKELIINPKDLKKENRNHICHICNNLIWMCVCKYASDNEIPFVASGLSLEQLNSGRKYPLMINTMANRIAEKSTKMINSQMMNYILDNDALKNETLSSNLYEYINNRNKYSVTTVYPYIYHNISVEEQKKIIIEYGKWQPPVDLSIDKYVSSGCEIMNKIIFELEKLELVTLNEREEAKRMISSGLINKDVVGFAYQDVSKEKVDLDSSIFDELGIREYLENIAKNRNQLG